MVFCSRTRRSSVSNGSVEGLSEVPGQSRVASVSAVEGTVSTC